MINYEIHNSSQLESICYDENLLGLEIRFKKGTIYRYYDVPHYIVEELLNATSAGSYFNKHIAKNFKFEKVEFYG